MQLTSELLRVVEMPAAPGQPDPVEIHALGNAQIWGRTFSGSGERLSYARAKDQLILTGDGYNDVRLSFQKTPQAPPIELVGETVEFNPQRKAFKSEIRSLETRLDQHGARGTVVRSTTSPDYNISRLDISRWALAEPFQASTSLDFWRGRGLLRRDFRDCRIFFWAEVSWVHVYS